MRIFNGKHFNSIDLPARNSFRIFLAFLSRNTNRSSKYILRFQSTGFGFREKIFFLSKHYIKSRPDSADDLGQKR